jgi:hypothetical protein
MVHAQHLSAPGKPPPCRNSPSVLVYELFATQGVAVFGQMFAKNIKVARAEDWKPWHGQGIKPDSFLAALRANGSLHVLEVGGDDEDESEFMTPTQWRFAEACLERNRVMPALLGGEKDIPALVPRIFAAAQDAPRTTPSILFQGLLAQLRHIEGNGMVKRVPPADKNPKTHTANRHCRLFMTSCSSYPILDPQAN